MTGPQDARLAGQTNEGTPAEPAAEGSEPAEPAPDAATPVPAAAPADAALAAAPTEGIALPPVQPAPPAQAAPPAAAEPAAPGQVAWSSPPPQAWGQPGTPAAPPPVQAAAPPWAPATAAAPAAAGAAGSGAVMVAGVILAIAGGLLLLVGGLLVLGGAAMVGSGGLFQDTSNGDVPEGLFGAVGGFVVAFGAMFALYGILDIVAAVGVFMRREWGRFFGAVLAGIAAVLTSLVGLAALGSLNNGSGSAIFFVITGLFAVAYWYALVVLARNGAVFRRA